jgi:hypothetical protein
VTRESSSSLYSSLSVDMVRTMGIVYTTVCYRRIGRRCRFKVFATSSENTPACSTYKTEYITVHVQRTMATDVNDQ